MQILNQFKDEGLEADLVDMQRYAAWKAADIRKALREGRSPTPGAPGGDVPTASTITLSGPQRYLYSHSRMLPNKPMCALLYPLLSLAFLLVVAAVLLPQLAVDATALI